jgi:hypothetical protein
MINSRVDSQDKSLSEQINPVLKRTGFIALRIDIRTTDNTNPLYQAARRRLSTICDMKRIENARAVLRTFGAYQASK